MPRTNCFTSVIIVKSCEGVIVETTMPEERQKDHSMRRIITEYCKSNSTLETGFTVKIK